MDYGFIGLGNMAGAILRGMRNSGRFENDRIFGFNRSEGKTLALRDECGVIPVSSALECAEKSDVIILAVKPQNLGDVLPQIAPALSDGKLVVTIAAGKSISYYEELLPENTPVVRAMPNINARVLAAITALCASSCARQRHLDIAGKVFDTVGKTVYITEELFPAFGAVGGSSVAFVYMYIDALIQAQKTVGVPDDDARMIAAQSVLGSAQLVLGCGDAPLELTRQVCSPGGTTIEGVELLNARGFESDVKDAIAAVLRKDEILRKGR